MPKREPRPNIKPDTTFFAMHIPYPLTAIWAEEDAKACALWVAEVIGNPHWLIMIHDMRSKKSNIIILEISKEFKNLRVLLGEHAWKDFLKDPTAEEAATKSSVFYSAYTTDDDVRNGGWTPIRSDAKLEESWFENWQPGTGRFVYPYPETKFCYPPSENITNEPICRPLPVDIMPPPSRTTDPVVGSPEWVAKQQTSKPTKQALQGAWGKQSLAVKVAGPVSKTPRPAAISPEPMSPPDAKPAKSKTIPLKNFMSDGSTTAPNTQAQWATVVKIIPTPSPFTEQPPAEPQNAWTKRHGLKNPKAKIIAYNEIDNSAWKPEPAHSWFNEVESAAPYSADANEAPPVPMPMISDGHPRSPTEPSIAVMDEAWGEAAADTIEGIISPWENVHISQYPGSSTGSSDEHLPRTPNEDEPLHSPVDDEPGQWACPDPMHKLKCPRGICTLYAAEKRRLRQLERQSEQQGRIQQQRRNGGKRDETNGRGARGSGWGKPSVNGNRQQTSRIQGTDSDGFQVKSRRGGRRW